MKPRSASTQERQQGKWQRRESQRQVLASHLTREMKFIFFGLTISSSWGNGHATPYRAILRALNSLGHEIHFFEKDAEYYRAHRDLTNCAFCRLTLYPDWDSIRRAALSEAASADVIVTASYLPEGRRINDEILELGRPLRVFYDLDTPVTLHGLATGGVDYLRRDQIAAFDLILSFTGGTILNELKCKYEARLARPLYGCVDPDDYSPVNAAPEFACDLSYMATYARDRQTGVDELLFEPARRNPERVFLLAGSLYPWNRPWPANVRHIEHVAPQAHARFYSSSRITLNITREGMARSGWCPSGRFFEATACGTPVISDWWEGLDSFFDVLREIRVVTRAEHVNNALNLSSSELRALGVRARQHTLDDHTGRVRARQLLEYLEEARPAVVIGKSEAGR